MSITLNDVKVLTDELTALRSRLEASDVVSSKVTTLLASIEAALSDTADAVVEAAGRKPDDTALKELIRAISALKITAPAVNLAPVFNVPESPAPTVEVNPVFNVPAVNPVFNVPERTTPAWASISVRPVRDLRTGDVTEYIVKRIS